LAAAQFTTCGQQPLTNCTTAGMNCVERAPSCFRRNFVDTTVPGCATDMMTCAGTQCATGMGVTDSKTCSTCRDTCANQLTNETCSAAANVPTCGWAVASCVNGPTPQPARACSGTSRTTCTGETGCFWMSYTSTICGTPRTTLYCGLCNSTATPLNVRSAVKNNQGKTCTWTASTPYSTAYSLTINDVAQNSVVAECPAFAAVTADDEKNLKDIVAAGNANPPGVSPFGGVPFGAAAVVTCKQASGVAALVPSLFVLGLIALA